VGNGQEQVTLVLEPRFGSLILTFGTVSVSAGMIAVLIFLTVFTEIDLSAKGFGAALDNILHRFEMLVRHSVAVFGQIGLTVDSKYLCQFHHTPVTTSP
jgi:hypothetical protein